MALVRNRRTYPLDLSGGRILGPRDSDEDTANVDLSNPHEGALLEAGASEIIDADTAPPPPAAPAPTTFRRVRLGKASLEDEVVLEARRDGDLYPRFELSIDGGMSTGDGTEAPQPGSAPGGSGVTFVSTDDDLPETTTGHPVVLVLEDGGALDGEGNPQATLRYWSGSDWRIIGLAGGGAVSSDFIEINLVGAPSIGQTIVWDEAEERFVPGELVRE